MRTFFIKIFFLISLLTFLLGCVNNDKKEVKTAPVPDSDEWFPRKPGSILIYGAPSSADSAGLAVSIRQFLVIHEKQLPLLVKWLNDPVKYYKIPEIGKKLYNDFSKNKYKGNILYVLFPDPQYFNGKSFGEFINEYNETWKKITLRVIKANKSNFTNEMFPPYKEGECKSISRQFKNNSSTIILLQSLNYTVFSSLNHLKINLNILHQSPEDVVFSNYKFSPFIMYWNEQGNIHYIVKGLGVLASYIQDSKEEISKDIDYYKDFFQPCIISKDHTLFFRLVYYYIPSNDGKLYEFIDPYFFDKGADGELKMKNISPKSVSWKAYLKQKVR